MIGGSGFVGMSSPAPKTARSLSRARNWYHDVGHPRDLKLLLGEQAENYQEMIDDNNAALRRNSKRFMLGAMAGLAAPFAGGLTWAVLQFYVP